jgi:hypothetical protein
MQSFLNAVSSFMLNGSQTANILLRFSGFGSPTLKLPFSGLFVSALAGLLLAWVTMKIFSKVDEENCLRPSSPLEWSHLILSAPILVATLGLAYYLPYNPCATYGCIPWLLFTYPLWPWIAELGQKRRTCPRRFSVEP